MKVTLDLIKVAVKEEKSLEIWKAISGSDESVVEVDLSVAMLRVVEGEGMERGDFIILPIVFAWRALFNVLLSAFDDPVDAKVCVLYVGLMASLGVPFKYADVFLLTASKLFDREGLGTSLPSNETLAGRVIVERVIALLGEYGGVDAKVPAIPPGVSEAEVGDVAVANPSLLVN